MKTEFEANNRIEIDLGFATLTVEKSADPNFPREIYVGLEKDGQWLQDIAVVAQRRDYEDDKLAYKKSIRVLVYADKDSEDYTSAFNIGIHEEES